MLVVKLLVGLNLQNKIGIDSSKLTIKKKEKALITNAYQQAPHFLVTGLGVLKYMYIQCAPPLVCRVCLCMSYYGEIPKLIR